MVNKNLHHEVKAKRVRFVGDEKRGPGVFRDDKERLNGKELEEREE